jgi:hypothetical protein
MLKLNKSEEKVMAMIEKYGNYVAVTYEKRMYNASKSLIEKDLVVVTEPEEIKKTSYYGGKCERWYQFKIVTK